MWDIKQRRRDLFLLDETSWLLTPTEVQETDGKTRKVGESFGVVKFRRFRLKKINLMNS